VTTHPQLARFASGWLYQSFDAESTNPAGAALKFVRVEEGRADALIQELSNLLDSHQSDARLASALRKLGADYAPRKAGRLRRELVEALQVVRDWGQHRAELANVIRAAVADRVYIPADEVAARLSRLVAALLADRSDYQLMLSITELLEEQLDLTPSALRQRLTALLASMG
jgi:hypothetical protein